MDDGREFWESYPFDLTHQPPQQCPLSCSEALYRTTSSHTWILAISCATSVASLAPCLKTHRFSHRLHSFTLTTQHMPHVFIRTSRPHFFASHQAMGKHNSSTPWSSTKLPTHWLPGCPPTRNASQQLELWWPCDARPDWPHVGCQAPRANCWKPYEKDGEILEI